MNSGLSIILRLLSFLSSLHTRHTGYPGLGPKLYGSSSVKIVVEFVSSEGEEEGEGLFLAVVVVLLSLI